jgi:predicted lipoprotein with Yx(FWY)xxD motif
MKRFLIAVAAALAVLALAACGGGEADSSDSPAAAPAGNGATTVSVEEIGDAGPVLVGPDGKALYTADEETNGDVLCDDACLSFWTPLTIDVGNPTATSVPGTLGVSERPDGARQVTLDGKRLYSFAEDGPAEVTADGLADAFGGQQFTWHVVRVAGSPDSGSEGSTTDGPFDY